MNVYCMLIHTKRIWGNKMMHRKGPKMAQKWHEICKIEPKMNQKMKRKCGPNRN